MERTTPAEFHLMLTLAEGPVHGYAIRREVEARTGGEVRLWPATLYRLLDRLQDRGWIEEVEVVDGPDDEVQRRYYALTGRGRSALRAETDRLAALVRLARTKQASAESA